MRVPVPHGGKVSAVLAPRPMAFLAVQVFFEGQPSLGRQAQFFEYAEDADDNKGDSVGSAMTTDNNGVARLPRLVATGHYVCEIDGQDDAMVSTVDRLKDAYPVYLPVDAEVVDVHAHAPNADTTDEGGN
jgi:hypothetical protein